MTQESKPQTPIAERRAPSGGPADPVPDRVGWNWLGSHDRSNACAAPASRDRRRRAIGLPVLRRRLRPARLPRGRQGRVGRRRSRVADIRGRLCPKGAASYELLTHAARHAREVPRPGATAWIEIDLETAMDMIAERDVGVARTALRRAPAATAGTRSCSPRRVAHLGGATLDNEENYLIKKLFTGGLGMVASAIRPGYDIAPPCPVWAPRSAAAVPRRRCRICRTRTRS